jgi:hypothetical protein
MPGLIQHPLTDTSINSKVPLLGMLSGMHSGFVSPEAYTIFGSFFKKNEFKIRYKRAYLFRCKLGVLKLKLHGKSIPAHCFTIISQLPFLHYYLNFFSAVILYTEFQPGLSFLCDQPGQIQFYCLTAWNAFTPYLAKSLYYMKTTV